MNSSIQDLVVPQLNVTDNGVQEKPPLPKSTLLLRALLVVVLVLLLCGIGYACITYYQNSRSGLVSPVTNNVQSPTISPVPTVSTDVTATWQTYRNEEYGFEFKYPIEYLLAQAGLGQGNLNQEPLIELESRLEKPSLNYGINSNVTISAKSNGTFECEYTPRGVIDTVQNIEINGVNFTKFLVSGAATGNTFSNEVYHYIVNSTCYEIVLTIHESSDGNNRPSETYVNRQKEILQDSLDQILSTFRFVENSTALDTKELCVQAGGVWQNWGLFPGEYCQIPAQDGGKACTDGSECELHSCITYTDSPNGQCSTYEDTFGCYSELTDGKISPKLCYD